ncbi:ATP-binding protein [Candidatus Micrarchaeota archaeon]|nr:ATP-binding protein [Candidatus Micrarchaeota archaeon]
MDKEFIIKYLLEKNYWWDGINIKNIDKGIIREEYLNDLDIALKYRKAVCITGIRRSGKTTLMYQKIDDLLKHGINPKFIFYFKIDDLIGKADNIQQVLDTYVEITGIDFRKNKIYVFIDEIQYLKNWQHQIKYYIDSKSPIKFILSGSSRVLLYLDSSESLAGRIRFMEVWPLTFREFLKFNDLQVDKTKVNEIYKELLKNKAKVVYLFNLYLKVGGFPEWFDVKDIVEWHKMLVSDYLNLILFRDIVTVFKIKDPILMRRLVDEIAKFSTERFSYLSLSDRVEGNRETIKQYLFYLECAQIIMNSNVFFKTKKSHEKLPKKLYLWEEGLRQALTLDKNKSKGAENLVAWHLTKIGRKANQMFVPFYWKNETEVDYVYYDSKKTIPVEVKYKNNLSQNDLKGMIEFMERFDIKKGIIITKNNYEIKSIKGRKIYLIPILVFLCMTSI